MSNEEIMDNKTIQHLVGFLEPKAWATAIFDHKEVGLDLDLIWSLIRRQDELYYSDKELIYAVRNELTRMELNK